MMTGSYTLFRFSITMTFTISKFQTISSKITFLKWDTEIASREFAHSGSLPYAGYQWHHSRGSPMYSCRSMSSKMTPGNYHTCTHRMFYGNFSRLQRTRGLSPARLHWFDSYVHRSMTPKSVMPTTPLCIDIQLKEWHSESVEETYLFNSQLGVVSCTFQSRFVWSIYPLNNLIRQELHGIIF